MSKEPRWVEITDAYVLAVLAIGLVVGEIHTIAGIAIFALAVIVALTL
jgi:hypothetical protein